MKVEELKEITLLPFLDFEPELSCELLDCETRIDG